MGMRLKKYGLSRKVLVEKNPSIEVRSGMRLNTIIMNDLLYGVGHRPTLPSCFEDDSELQTEGVDPMSDMRHDPWHDASNKMNPQFGTATEVAIGDDSSDVETPPADVDKDN